MTMPAGLSVAIITLNAAGRLADCIRSAGFADEIVVVDSGSSDATVDIARDLGCRVLRQAFLGFGPQKQFAVDHCRHDWILLLDADECAAPGAEGTIRDALAAAEMDVAAYCLQRRNHLHGRWIRRCGWWPDPLVRLVNRRRGRFSSDIVHERWLADGPVQPLPCYIDHHSFRDYAEMIEKLQHYSTLSALRLRDEKRAVGAVSPLLHGLWTFVQVYGLKLGFLEGFDGFMIAALHAGGSFMKYAKYLELVKYTRQDEGGTGD